MAGIDCLICFDAVLQTSLGLYYLVKNISCNKEGLLWQCRLPSTSTDTPTVRFHTGGGGGPPGGLGLMRQDRRVRVGIFLLNFLFRQPSVLCMKVPACT